MGVLFGTDGVRGIANTELSPELAFKLGYYGARVLAADLQQKPRFVIGHDTRLSSSMLENALCAGICSAGADAYCCGTIPTPGIAYLTAEKEFSAGVVISASHNPYEFNGIKFFNSTGFKLSDEIEDQIEAYITGTRADDLPRPTGDALGTVFPYPQGIDAYMAHLRYAMGLDLHGLKIAMDCANGAAYSIAPRIFRNLGAELHLIGDIPDGININSGCGSTDLRALSELVVREKCDIGLAFDGDADRLLAIDHTGREVDGDEIMAILAEYLRSKNLLGKDTLVITVMSNLGLTKHAETANLNIVTTKVGDRYVMEAMREGGYTLGGEQSGHFIMLDFATTGDGILSALALLKALRKSHKTLHEAAKTVTIYPQVLLKTKVRNENKSKILDLPEVATAITKVQAVLGGNGRVLVRPSGTEPVIRVMIEGQDTEAIKAQAEELVKIIETAEAAL